MRADSLGVPRSVGNSRESLLSAEGARLSAESLRQKEGALVSEARAL